MSPSWSILLKGVLCCALAACASNVCADGGECASPAEASGDEFSTLLTVARLARSHRLAAQSVNETVNKTVNAASCTLDGKDAGCFRQGPPECSSSDCWDLKYLLKNATMLVDKGGKLTLDDLHFPHKVFCEAIQAQDETVCKQAYDVIDEWMGLAVYSWVHDMALDPGVSAWGMTYSQVCANQHKYATGVPTYEWMKASDQCTACQACNRDCYDYMAPLFSKLQSAYITSVKPLLRSMVQTVAWLKYTQRVAQEYSIGKACHDVFDSMVKQPSPPSPHRNMAEIMATIMKEALFSFTHSASASFNFIPGVKGTGADAIASMIRLFEKVVIPIMEANAQDPNDAFVPNPASPLYSAQGKLDYSCDAMRKYYFLVYDRMADYVRIQTSVAIQSAWARKLLAEGKVDFNGTQSEAKDVDIGYCVDPHGTDLSSDSSGFAIADYSIRYSAYQKLMPITYQVCTESRRLCESGVDVMADYQIMGRYRLSTLWCMAPKTDFSWGCDRGSHNLCVKDHLDVSNSRILWDEQRGGSSTAAQLLQSSGPVGRNGTSGRNETSGPQLLQSPLLQAFGDGGCPGNCGPGMCGGSPGACSVFKDYSKVRTKEIDDPRFAGWFCGWEDAFNEGERGQAPVMPSNALQDDLDLLLKVFTAYDSETKEGFKDMTELLAPQVVGNPERKMLTDQSGWTFIIRRLPDGDFFRSKFAAATTWSEQYNTCDLKCGTDGSGESCNDVRTRFSQGCCGSERCMAYGPLPADEGEACDPDWPKPCANETLLCGVRSAGLENMWACCESVDERNVCKGLKVPDTLVNGACLHAENSLRSDGGDWELRMQGDGNLVVYGKAGHNWESATSGDNAKVCMQGDGNLVVYTSNSATSLSGVGSGMYAVMQRDGNLVVYQNQPTLEALTGNSEHPSVWATGSDDRRRRR